MQGISSKASGGIENKNGYNGNELQGKEFKDGSGLDLYDFNVRTYNQQIGRFIQIDPLSEEGDQESWSPYHFAYNNPVRYADPDGEIPIIPIVWGLYELGSAIYDGYQAYKTVSNKSASRGEKVAAVGGALLGAVLPGGGYGTAAKTTVKAFDNATDAKKVLSKAEQLAKNKKAGKAGETKVKSELTAELKKGETLLEQPSFKLQNGKRAKPDFAVVDKNGDIVKTVDSKTGNAKLSSNQKELQNSGGTLTGKKYQQFNGAQAKPKTLEQRKGD